MKRFMYGFARTRPGLKLADQKAALTAFAGDAELKLVEERRGSEIGLPELLNALRPGNVLIVYRLVALVPPKQELGKKAPRTALKEILQTLVEKKVKVIEVQTGRTCDNPGDAALAVAEAFTDLSGYKRQKAGPGRPKAEPLEETERLRLIAIWKNSIDYPTNAAAVAAMGGKWTVSKAIKTFGNSGRGTGRPKK